MKASTASKRAIIDRLETRPVQADPLPELDTSLLSVFDHPIDKYVEMLGLVGGEAHLVAGESEVRPILDSIPAFSEANQIASLVPEAVQGNIDAAAIADPHQLSTLDWVIARGEFIVAENGAIWVDGASLPHRVMLFIPQYLAIVVSRGQIADHMHQAYARIRRPVSRFGVFVSGPSKTADIEQSLVLGAHGCRTLQVFLTP